MQAEKRARLPERHELKYFINRGDMIALAHRLGGVLAHDAYAQESGEYAIRSLYFDDAYNRAYYEKMDGIADRDKYRIRIYNESDEVIFLERKRKRGDLIQKSSVRITRRLCEQLMRGDATGLLQTDVKLLQDLYCEMRTNLLRPAVIVDYHREAFVYPVEDVRITFDKRVCTGLTNLNLFDPTLPLVSVFDDAREVLEVKFNTYLPDFIRALLRDVPVEHTAISKYTYCRRFEPLK